MIQSKLSQYRLIAVKGRERGYQLSLGRSFAVFATALSLIAGAFFIFLFSAVDSTAEAAPAGCEEAAEVAVLPSPIAPWKGAPLRVLFAAEKPLDGELSLIAPDGSVAAKSRERQGGPPYFWFAEVASPAAGTWHATLARDRAPAACSTITREIAVSAQQAAAAARGGGQRLAAAQHLEPRDGKPVFGMDRQAVRRAARRGAVLEGAGTKCCATGRAISCSIIWDSAKTTWRWPSPRLRRLRLLLARLFRLQDGAAVRLFELLARRRRRAAEMQRSGSTFSIPKSTRPAPPPEQDGSAAAPPATAQPRRSRLCLQQLFSSRSRPSQPASRPPVAREAACAEAAGAVAGSAIICGPSATSSIPVPCGRRRTATTPIFTPSR